MKLKDTVSGAETCGPASSLALAKASPAEALHRAAVSRICENDIRTSTDIISTHVLTFEVSTFSAFSATCATTCKSIDATVKAQFLQSTKPVLRQIQQVN